MPSKLTISKHKEGDVVVVSPEGSIDTHTAPDFEKALKDLLESGQVKVVVDMSGVSYISSAGIGVFMSLIGDFRSKGGDIKAASMSDKVYKVFETVGFTGILDIKNSVEEAVKAF